MLRSVFVVVKSWAPAALALTLLYALGTSTWSISSQALWAHALGEVCLAALCLLMARGGGSWRWYAAVGAACVLMVWNRAQMAPFALMGFLYVVSLDRRIALLANAEGLRHHAATHGGKWPTSLAEVELPLPPDPMTDKPFAYRIDGATAILDAPAPKGADASAHAFRVELTLKK